jgi:tetratricopeptide (TPR) repeat protein
MTCTTCHDPHREIPQPEAARYYSEKCLHCHAAKLAALTAANRHSVNPDCIACHMPKRRTQDAIHVVMTDHFIQKTKPDLDLLAPLREVVASDGPVEVAPWYPSTLLRAADDLYLGVAQVNEKSTRGEGITRLSAAIAKFQPAAAEYYLELGDALRASRRFTEAIGPYEEAVRREPQSAVAHQRLAWGLTRVQQYPRADAEFSEALRLARPELKVSILKDLGLAYLEQGRMPDAATAFERSLAIDAGQHEAHNGLGGARLKTGDSVGAEAEFRQAIHLRPHYAEAHHNLA